MKNNNLNLNTIQTVYDFGNFTKSQINILNFYLSNSKYKNKFKKIRKDEKVVLDLKKNIDVFLNEIKTECNISFFYHRSSELIDVMIEYYDLINRYDELFNAILFKTKNPSQRCRAFSGLKLLRNLLKNPQKLNCTSTLYALYIEF